jgi:hypothetical protein
MHVCWHGSLIWPACFSGGSCADPLKILPEALLALNAVAHGVLGGLGQYDAT